MMTTKNRVGSLFREERKKRGLNKKIKKSFSSVCFLQKLEEIIYETRTHWKDVLVDPSLNSLPLVVMRCHCIKNRLKKSR